MTSTLGTVTNDRPLVIDCPECKRTIWAGSVCHHGRPPAPDAAICEVELPAEPPPSYPGELVKCKACGTNYRPAGLRNPNTCPGCGATNRGR